RHREVLLRNLEGAFGDEAAEPVAVAQSMAGPGVYSRAYQSPMPPGFLTEYGPLLREPTGAVHWAAAETAGFPENSTLEGALTSAQTRPSQQAGSPPCPAPPWAAGAGRRRCTDRYSSPSGPAVSAAGEPCGSQTGVPARTSSAPSPRSSRPPPESGTSSTSSRSSAGCAVPPGGSREAPASSWRGSASSRQNRSGGAGSLGMGASPSLKGVLPRAPVGAVPDASSAGPGRRRRGAPAPSGPERTERTEGSGRAARTAGPPSRTPASGGDPRTAGVRGGGGTGPVRAGPAALRRPVPAASGSRRGRARGERTAGAYRSRRRGGRVLGAGQGGGGPAAPRWPEPAVSGRRGRRVPPCEDAPSAAGPAALRHPASASGFR